jgi:hypothetical protein
MLKILMFVFLPIILVGQEFQSWNTFNIKGKLGDKWELAAEPELRYSLSDIEYFHFDIGVIYKVVGDLKIGVYYREIFENKSNIRVHEMRPHIDVFYKFNKYFKVRLRNEYQIKQISDNVWRIRVRPTFTYKIHNLFQPYIQTEPFFTDKGFVRNRLNIGIGLVHKKMWFKPGYQLQTDLKNGIVSQIHTLWINVGIKL